MPQPQPLAVIDIGSNSGRVIVVRLSSGGHLEILSDARTSLRLIRDLNGSGKLGAQAVDRTIAAVNDFLAVAESAGAKRIVAVATAAVREANNGADFVAQVEDATGIEVRVIDGDEEARYAFLGAVHGLPVESGLLVDVGGGSLEISHFRSRRALRGWTLPLGALRLTDRFLAADPPKQSEVTRLHDHVVQTLQDAGLPVLRPDEAMIGTGGTIRNIAKMHRAAATSYPIPRLHGYTLSRKGLRDVAQNVLAKPLRRRSAISGLSVDRADSIVGGVLVVQAVMDAIGATDMTVSGQGLREGIAFEELSHRLPSTGAVRQSSLEALAARFTTWDATRARRRARLAAVLLDLLVPDAGDEMQETLDHAATILDAGRSVDYYNRWEHAADIVRSADLRGFSHRSIALLSALITRAGRDRASLSPYSALIDAIDRRAVDRAAMVLVLADEVERRMPKGTAVAATRRDRRGTVVLSLPVPHEWQGVEVSTRFHRVFGRSLVVEPLAG
ncbi:MAG TPA: Ppx/GppA phosphatase family protein [Candidatus Dormibacteraeota bacterium]|nr:Ppx/GppA phosphatase family protein [Candidatus Dormibacteraeota bacterium]